ncbi:MAG: ABC transporter ATP-binding protein [Bacteroides sp.]|nr:ABC transporter ATP-binding protein [Bacteroidales bacterium]MDD7490074.1 ABC transporter ATP-binding protein [Bacteroides sp.]MDY5890726.1 ABC transporter ATP-binding protein [Candidatus Cryptobacteroides sp.]
MKEFWSILREYVPPYKKYLVGSVVMNILSAVFNVFSFSLLIPILQILFNISDATYEFIPWHRGMDFGDLTNNVYWYIDTLVAASGPARVLLGLCVTFCAIVFIKTACYFGAAAVMVPIRTGIVKDLRMQIYNKILSLPLGFFSQERKGDIIARISGDVQEVENSITSTLEMLIKNPVLIIIYMSVLLIMSWELTLFTILFAPVMIWTMGAIGRKLRAQSAEAQQYWSDTMSQVEETLGGLRIIKAFLAENKMSARFEGITDAMRRKNNRVAVRQASAHPVSELLGSTMIAIVLWFGGTLILSSKSIIDAPSFMSYMAILYCIIQPIKDLSRAAYGIPKGLASMERINVILNAENPITQTPFSKHISTFNEAISFEDVSFCYEQGGKQVLKNIDLKISKGRNIAIVGASGAGKSTLVDLIPRFYDPTSGRITIDGINIKDVCIRDLRGLMGNVNQDPILFNDTIFNNIAFGVENATMEQVIAAAKIANAHDFIMEKENGYDTNIGDRGQLLSGGQRQRISIARAILQNPPILILDEATASLDTESERMVQEALDYLMSSRTTISIAHRLSTVKKADEIIVMNEGRIVERGTHDELLLKNGYYKKLYEMQVL